VIEKEKETGSPRTISDSKLEDNKKCDSEVLKGSRGSTSSGNTRPYYRDEATRLLHNQRIASSQKEHWRRIRAGENPPPKKVIAVVLREPKKPTVSRCKGCNALCDNQSTLEVHQRFCEEFKKYQQGVRF